MVASRKSCVRRARRRAENFELRTLLGGHIATTQQRSDITKAAKKEETITLFSHAMGKRNEKTAGKRDGIEWYPLVCSLK